MKGQWLGTFKGSRSGSITLNLDEGPEEYSGYAHLIDDSGKLPPVFAILRSKGKTNPLSLEASTVPVHGATHATLTPAELERDFPGFTFSKTAKVKGELDGRYLKVEWTTDIGTTGNAALTGGTAEDKSSYKAEAISWTKFKAKMDSYPARKFIFRGQEKAWKLRTSFHRTGRADVFKFEFGDIPALHRVLSSRTKHIYNLSDAEQNGAFYHLVQHHGYPTPLLDWSYSPFVAAFCAYRKISPDLDAGKSKVRVFMFDHIKWHKDWERIQTLRTYKLHLSVLDFTAIDNDRMIPQQALSCVTNIDDIEKYIRRKEDEKKTSYLKVFDLPASERKQAMMDLSVMGITAGSMFPGLDGMCEELKERLFNFRN